MRWLASERFGGVELTDDRTRLLSEPWVYEFMRSEYHGDVELSRNERKLVSGLSSYWGRPDPELGRT